MLCASYGCFLAGHSARGVYPGENTDRVQGREVCLCLCVCMCVCVGPLRATYVCSISTHSTRGVFPDENTERV